MNLSVTIRTLLLIFSLLISVGVHAQHQISGVIRSPQYTPVPNASILLHIISDSSKSLVAFTYSDNRGFFSLTAPGDRKRYLLTIRADNYKNVEKAISFTDDTASLETDFTVYPSVSYLDTVQINVKFTISKTGDTITFNPDAYSRKNETNIEELLRNIPGMEVKDDGKISFNGTPVTNVLIDGDDLFKKNYQQLTQSAAPKIVDKIEVIKNYQKDGLLKEFNQAGTQVINLKLREKFKSYLFGNARIAYGDNKNKAADVFLIKLAPSLKSEAGINFNTIGNTYAISNTFDLSEYLAGNESGFLSYNALPPLLSINQYYFQSIPIYYQQRNRSIQGHTNLLSKRNGWENVLNVKIAGDTLGHRQYFSTAYADGTELFQDDLGTERDEVQDYSFTSSKSKDKQSFAVNTSLLKRVKQYRMATQSNESLHSIQDLNNMNIAWQVNARYNRRIASGTLWSNTFGYYQQTRTEELQTEPDFLFWLFPGDLSLNNLQSNITTRFRFAKLKSEIIKINKHIIHNFGISFTSDRKRFFSTLESQRKSDNYSEIPFTNDSYYDQYNLSLDYTGQLRLSEKNTFTLKFANTPTEVHYRDNNKKAQVQSDFFYDYSIGISSKKRTGGLGLNVGLKRQAENNDYFFSDPVQSSFHYLQSGMPNPAGARAIYLQFAQNAFNLKRQLVSFFMVNLSRNRSYVIRDRKTAEIGAVQTLLYYPNTTNSLNVVLNARKALGNSPISVRSNIWFNLRSAIYSFNGTITRSDIQSTNFLVGTKSLFESLFNFEYNFSILRSFNAVKTPVRRKSNTQTILNEANLYFVAKKVFNSTVSFKRMTNQSMSVKGSFLDIAVNRKVLNERLILELSARNIFNNKYIGNQIITPYAVNENIVFIRGAEFFIRVRYEIR